MRGVVCGPLFAGCEIFTRHDIQDRMDRNAKINIAKEKLYVLFFLGSLPRVLASVQAIQLSFWPLFRHMEMSIRMNINFFEFE